MEDERRHVVALVDVEADRVLVVPGDLGPELPAVAERWPSPGDLAAAVGDPTARPVLAPYRPDEIAVVNVLATTAPATDRDWRPTADVDPRLAAAVRELREDRRTDAGPDWWRLTWFDEVDAWVDEVLAARGETRVGRGEPVKMWSLSAVVRYLVRSAGGQVEERWFKATCEGFRAEPSITAWLAGVAPGLLPRVVAHDPDRAWMLLEPIDGADDDPSLTEVLEVARAVAELQLTTLGRLDGLLVAGAPDRGAAHTVAALHDVVRAGVELPSLSEERRAAVVAAEPRLSAMVEELHGLGLPPTLVHGDLHLWNIGRRPGPDGSGPVVFDWTDACVGHPYLDARHLARSARHVLGEEAVDAVRDAFLDVWRPAYPDVDHDRAWELSLVGDRVFTLVSYEGIYRAQRPADRWELAGVGVEILDELVGLARDHSPNP